MTIAQSGETNGPNRTGVLQRLAMNPSGETGMETGDVVGLHSLLGLRRSLAPSRRRLSLAHPHAALRTQFPRF